MQVDQFRPPPGHPLYSYVDAFWQLEHNGELSSEVLLPKNTVGIIFCLEEAEEYTNGAFHYQLKSCQSHVFGLHTVAATSLHRGRTHLFGIELNSVGSSALLPLPPVEILNLAVAGDSIFPNQHDLYEQIAEAQDFAARCRIASAFLCSQLRERPHLRLVQYACALLRADPESRTIDQLTHELGISSRHLRRLMVRDVGIGPAQYVRFCRFVNSLYLLPQAATLAEVAHATHYADQAHFTRDFKDFARMTPQEYRKRMSDVPGHLFTP